MWTTRNFRWTTWTRGWRPGAGPWRNCYRAMRNQGQIGPNVTGTTEIRYTLRVQLKPHSPVATGELWWDNTPQTMHQSPQIEIWNTVNKWRFVNFYNVKPPCWTLSGDGSTTIILKVEASYCGKASPDLLLSQCHDDLRVVINLHVPNIHCFIEGRFAKYFQAETGPQCENVCRPMTWTTLRITDLYIYCVFIDDRCQARAWICRSSYHEQFANERFLGK